MRLLPLFLALLLLAGCGVEDEAPTSSPDSKPEKQTVEKAEPETDQAKADMGDVEKAKLPVVQYYTLTGG